MDGLENKIESVVNFFVKFIRSITYLFFPKLFIKSIENDNNAITPPLTFLSIFSFGLIKFWKYILLMLIIGFKGCSMQVNNMAPTRTTVPEFSFIQSFGIPSIEEILLLSIPFVLLSVLLSKLFKKLASRLKLKYKIDSEALYIYTSSIVVLIFSISFILDLEYFSIIILILTPAYIFYILLLSAKTSLEVSKVKFYLVCASFAILIPVAQIGGIYLIMENYFKIVPHQDEIEKYVSQDLFETKLISHRTIQTESFLKILLRSNEKKTTEYYFVPNISHNIYDNDSLIIGEVVNIIYDSKVKPDQSVILDLKCKLKDTTVQLDDSYFSFNVINTTNLKERKILTKVTSANNVYKK
ncbi:hypothetical protein [Wandonia haliotis]|uniref:hypothetical protein n=1 Tax=Wandonia haliotis TaxID=574963 RepID=UPI0031D5DECB